MADLARRNCVPCTGETPPVTGKEAARLLALLDRWSMEKGHHLTRTFEFPDFAASLAFANRVGEMAEEQQHHPDIHISWGRVRLVIWTHAIDGLSENDFILAAKIDALQ